MKQTTWIPIALVASLLGCAAESERASSPSDDSAEDGRERDAGRSPGPGAPTASTVDDDACEALNIAAQPQAPEVLIVLDRSASMVGSGSRNTGKNRWIPSVSAIQKLTARLGDAVAFGLMTFPARADSVATVDPRASAFGAGPCTPGVLDVPVRTQSAAQIAGVLADAEPSWGATPTARTLEAAYAVLNQRCADCPVPPRYVLLVTDGQPTCGAGGLTVTLPEDIDATASAIDKLRAAGINTYVIGYDSASDPMAAAAMNEFARRGGTARHYAVEDEPSLLAELTRIAGSLAPCAYELGTDVVDPAYLRVTIDGQPIPARAGAWRLDGARRLVLEGACARLRDGQQHTLGIVDACHAPGVI